MTQWLTFPSSRGWRVERAVSWQTAVFVAAAVSLGFLLLMRFRLWYAAPFVFLFVLYVTVEIRHLRPQKIYRLTSLNKEAVESVVEQLLYEKGLPYRYENGRFQLDESPLSIQVISTPDARTKLLIAPVNRNQRPLTQSLKTRLNNALSDS